MNTQPSRQWEVTARLVLYKCTATTLTGEKAGRNTELIWTVCYWKLLQLLYQETKSDLELAARDVFPNSARKYIIYFNHFTVNTKYTLCRDGACCTKPEYVNIRFQFVQICSLLSRKSLA